MSQDFVRRLTDAGFVFERTAGLGDKIHVDFTLLLLLVGISAYGLLVLYSAVYPDYTAVVSQIIKIGVASLVMLLMAQIAPIFYLRVAPWLFFCGRRVVGVDALASDAGPGGVTEIFGAPFTVVVALAGQFSGRGAAVTDGAAVVLGLTDAEAVPVVAATPGVQRTDAFGDLGVRGRREFGGRTGVVQRAPFDGFIEASAIVPTAICGAGVAIVAGRRVGGELACPC